MKSMNEKNKEAQKKSKHRLRTGLMFMQILLPFGLYAAMQIDSQLAAGLIAIAFVLSMGAMVWVG